MSKIELLLLIVFLLLLILLFKYLQTKRQIRNLSKQIAELVNGKSEKMLDISLIDKDLEQLAGILNQYIDNQRQLIASTLRHENYLKESIANISHDLRTPLTVILGHLQLLRKETLTDRQARCTLFSSFFQVGKQLVKVIVALYRRVFCNPFRFQHGSNRFFVGLFQLHFKGNAALTKRLAHEDVERRG